MLPCLLSDLAAALCLFLLGRTPAVAGLPSAESRSAPAATAALLAASLYCLNPASLLAGAGCALPLRRRALVRSLPPLSSRRAGCGASL